MKERLQYSETPPYWRQELERSKTRMEDLNTRGVDAMSRYDIEIAHQGDAEAAVTMAKYLVGNHISYYEEKLKDTPEQIILFSLDDDS